MKKDGLFLAYLPFANYCLTFHNWPDTFWHLSMNAAPFIEPFTWLPSRHSFSGKLEVAISRGNHFPQLARYVLAFVHERRTLHRTVPLIAFKTFIVTLAKLSGELEIAISRGDYFPQLARHVLTFVHERCALHRAVSLVAFKTFILALAELSGELEIIANYLQLPFVFL